MSKIKLSKDFIRNTVKRALNEDLYPSGDITSSLVKNNKIIKMNNPIFIKANDVLTFGMLKSGLRSYIAILGGFKTEKVLGSRSMFKNLTKAVKLAKNDVLNFNEDIMLNLQSLGKYRNLSVCNEMAYRKQMVCESLRFLCDLSYTKRGFCKRFGIEQGAHTPFQLRRG